CVFPSESRPRPGLGGWAMFRAFLLVTSCTVALGTAPQAAAADYDSSRIRIANDRIEEMFRFAGDRSPTFRGLVRTIDGADVIVYVEEGRCTNGRLHSCVHFTAAPPARYVVIRLDPREQVLSVVRALAHELQHAVEIGTATDVVDDASAKQLYARLGY